MASCTEDDEGLYRVLTEEWARRLPQGPQKEPKGP